jgi:4-amino-4-deoxychorismate lyase
MRATVLALAAAGGVPVRECALSAQDLAAAEELFLTNALIGIRPVRELEGAALPLGPLTRRLRAELARLLGEAARE